jgi:DNA topoisomerase-1
MMPAVFDTVTISILAGEYGLRASGSILKFAGFLAVYADLSEEDEEKKLPVIKEKETLSRESVEDIQHFTEPPPRFTEAALIKLLEEKGIGRPSTYAPTIDTIQERGYVEKIEKKFHPTPLGFVVVDLLQEYFPEIVDAEFTAGMEEKLDQVAHGSVNWRQLMQEFYDPFLLTLQKADVESAKVKVPEELTDIPCELCGAPLTVKHGRFGTFLGCSKFPDCRYTKPIVKDAGVPCPLCGKAIVERKSKRGRMFYGCSGYPGCSFINWNKPVAQTCQQCGSYMVAKTYKNRDPVIECGSASCPSKSRSAEKTEKSNEIKSKDIKKTAPKRISASKSAAKNTRNTKK